ncbi:hypothetical protein [Xanthomonas phage vB_XooS_NR08]|nr:hypothetical protein [Xanthomonas phage vB_XooS_NR08]
MASKKNGNGKKASAPVIGLAEIVAAGANGLYTSPEVHGPLLEQGLVELNPAGPNETGETLTRATQKGIDSMNTETITSADVGNLSKVLSSSFAIEDNVPMPTASGRGRGGNVYPFDALQVGQSFFVPNTEDKPNAAKSLASTVSSATARYAEVVEGQFKTNKKGEQVPVTRETRKFVVRSVEGGARVWRTA